jgi:NHLM bacteriocin system ABC transporter peptidase/ATP-binding protein
MTTTAPAPERQRRRLMPKIRKSSVVPSVIQMEAVECGAACLAMVLAYYGSHVPLEVLRVECGVSRDGSNAASLLRAARLHGLTAKGFRMEAKEVASVRFPAVIFWQFQHFMVVEKVTNSRFRRGGPRYYVNDPASGRRRIGWPEFDSSFPGVILTFEPAADFRPGGRPNRFWDGLKDRARGTAAALSFVLLISLLLVIPGIATPAFSRIFLDRVLGSGEQSYVWPLVGAIGVAVVLTAALTWLQQQYLLRIETKVALSSSGRFFRHLLRLPVEFITQREPAEVASRLRGNDVVAQILSRDLATSALNLVLVAFYAVLMIRYSVLLSIVGIGLALLNIVVLRWVSRTRKDAVQRLRADRAKLIATSFNSIRIIETIKANGGENDSFQRWAGFQAKVLNSQQRLGQPTALLGVVPGVLATVNSGVILLIGGLKATEGAISIGLLVAFQMLLNSFTRPITQLTNLGQRLQEVTADMTRLRDVERYPEAPAFQVDPAGLVPITRLDGRLEMRKVSFGYSLLKPPLLKDFSLTLQPGRRVAIVGPSGSGKSTIGKLIVGLFPPRSGAIAFDGLAREQIPREVFASSVAYVDQDVFLFEGTVRENITLWDDSVPDDFVVRALQDADIYDTVAARPGSINSKVREGGLNFSGGQRQRLEIARALITQPALLVLDEAMSALDTSTEQRIDDNLRRRGCACVIIAHRLSTVRDADEIIVLDAGRVVQQGRHTDLIATPGVYADLIQASQETA